MSINENFKRIVLALALGMAFVGAANAQRTVGNVIGTATAGETVVAKNLNDGSQREVAVKADGKFRLASLQPGDYAIVVKHADGTESAPRTTSVRAGQTIRLQ